MMLIPFQEDRARALGHYEEDNEHCTSGRHELQTTNQDSVYSKETQVLPAAWA